LQQYCVEHSSIYNNTLVEAGAGTGKTHSMVSRVAFLCNKKKDNITNIEEELAMVTFTNDAAINMNKAYATALNDVVTEFKKSSRILDNDNPISPESKWATYRAAGLYIEVTSFDTITNASDSLHTEIQTRIEELYDVVMDSHRLHY
jgi:superfamily I DNA/RNA helicase